MRMGRIFKLIILFVFFSGIINLSYAESIYRNSGTLYEQNRGAAEIIRYNVYEYICDCLGKDVLEGVINENNSDLSFRIFYNPDGNLNKIMTNNMRVSFFSGKEWESIFDYLHELPPLPLPNCLTYINLYPYAIYTKDTITNSAHQSIIDFSKMIYSVALCPKETRANTELNTDTIKPFDIIEREIYDYEPYYRTEHPDSLFGLMRWEEVKRRYHDALKSGEFKEKPRIWGQIYDCEFDNERYIWEKIPIKNYSVNIQVPIDSKITIATDSLSAMVDFPDSTYVNIQYTKGDEWTKLYETETNPRQRQIYSSVITEKYLLSSGEFELDGKMIYWQRIRYRYGVTVTLYTYAKDNLTKYYSTVIAPITVVLRPKFKTIYLNDDGY